MDFSVFYRNRYSPTVDAFFKQIKLQKWGKKNTNAKFVQQVFYNFIYIFYL